MKRRELLVALGATVLGFPPTPFAQQPRKVYRIGYLHPATAASTEKGLEVMRGALQKLGYTEGMNVVYEYRWADNDNERLPTLAADLVHAQCDVIVTSGSPAILALKRATSTIPIVMHASGDAVRFGLVASLARPGGNVTGLSFFGPELYAKRAELIKEAVPAIRTLAFLSNPVNPIYEEITSLVEKAAAQLKLALRIIELRTTRDFEDAFAAMARQRVDAVVVPNDALFTSNREAIAALAAKHRIPSIGQAEMADVGCMMGFGPSNLDLYRRSATYVDKILRGAKPGELSVEQPTVFDLVINLKTARKLGIKVSSSVLLRATRVIE